MKTLNEMLNAYLGGDTNSEAALLRSGIYSEDDVNRIIAVIKDVAELDVPVTSSLFRRTLPDRFEETARLAREIVGHEDTPVPTFDRESLARQPKHVQRAYERLLNELYELAVLLKIVATHFDGKDCIRGEHEAIETWEQFCYYARGHPDQSERLRIARNQIALL